MGYLLRFRKSEKMTDEYTEQVDLWGNPVALDHGLAKVAAKIMRVISKHPEAASDDKMLLAFCWLEQDGLGEILETQARQRRFLEWYTNSASYSESVTRCRRELAQKGVIVPEAEATARRQAKAQNWQAHYAR